METIGDRIKNKRKELGWTQLDLAKKLNVTDRAVSKWEQGEGNPDFSLLSKLANQLGMSLDYLIAGISADDFPMPESECISNNNLHEIDKKKITASTLADGEKAVKQCLVGNILNIDDVMKIDNPQLIISAIASYPIHSYEIIERYLEEKNYRELFQFAVDQNITYTASLIADQEYARAKAEVEKLFIKNPRNEYFYIIDKMHSFNNHWFYRDINYIENVKKLKAVIDKTREEIIKTIIFDAEKNKQIGDYTYDYFVKEIEKGNYDGVVVKLCMVLEARLKYDYRYTGTFDEMLKKYCDTFETHDDEANNYDPYTPALLQKLRMARNTVVHSVDNPVRLTIEEVRKCVNYIVK